MIILMPIYFKNSLILMIGNQQQKILLQLKIL